MEPDQIYKYLGRRIKDLRKGLHQTQEQLAKQVGISRASLANIESGRQQLLVHHLFSLANALQLESPAQLLLLPQTRSSDESTDYTMPLSNEGLTEQQRREIFSLMGGILENNKISTYKEDV